MDEQLRAMSKDNGRIAHLPCNQKSRAKEGKTGPATDHREAVFTPDRQRQIIFEFSNTTQLVRSISFCPGKSLPFRPAIVISFVVIILTSLSYARLAPPEIVS